jgi:hypothetical protein
MITLAVIMLTLLALSCLSAWRAVAATDEGVMLAWVCSGVVALAMFATVAIAFVWLALR